jgi:hypothetical protein
VRRRIHQLRVAMRGEDRDQQDHDDGSGKHAFEVNSI